MKRLLILLIALSAFAFSSSALLATTDVAFVMDGSGSINSADFALQKDGIIGALNNALVVPRNGSIAITVVQYASNSTRVEVPFTVITSDNDVTTMVNQVNGIRQMGSLTNPGDGINRAMTVFNSSGRTDAEQCICLSTDGLQNAGADVATALTNGQSSTIGLDQFGVLAIEDPPWFFSQDFHNAYDSLVFGGGIVTVVRNAAEFANIVGSTCFPKDLELIGLEVIQTIQDWQNTVALIEDKTTYVRAHIQTKGSDPVQANARLRGFRNGTELSGSPLTAINPGGSIVARESAGERRGNWNDSLNFRLPQAWLNGSIELRLEAIGGGVDFIEPAEAGGNANDGIVLVTFEEADALEVRLVSISWTDASNNTHAPTSGDIINLQRRLLSIFPVNRIALSVSQLNYTGAVEAAGPVLAEVNQQLEAMRINDSCANGCERLYYGVLVDANRGGVANGIPGTVACGNVPVNEWAYGRNRHVHELAHTLSRFHSTDASNPGVYCSRDSDGRREIHSGTSCPTGWTLISDQYKLGACRNAVAPSTADDFPYMFSVNGTDRATIGPMESGQNSLIYGLDTNAMNVVDPTDNFELMSYCGTWRWISDYTYEGLHTTINDTFPSQPPSLNSSTADKYILLRGSVQLETDVIDFKPVGTIYSSTPLSDPMPGDYKAELKDFTGNVIQSILFQPNEYHGDYPEEDPGIATFLIPVLSTDNIEQVTIIKKQNSLATFTATPNPPKIQILYPNGGESLNTDQIVISWTGNDVDGDTLTYTVQYSADGGNIFETLVTDLVNTSYEINRSILCNTTNGLIRIIASDGFNTSQDESDGFFTVPNNEPEILIIYPKENNLFIGVQPIFFESYTNDKEDGNLSGTNLQWRSSINGSIGSGNNLIIESTDLSEGNHVITLTATDSGGAAVTKSVNIRVYRIAPPQLEGDIDSDGDVDRDDLRIILEARNTAATGDGDPRDLDGDGMITSRDSRKLVTLCTRPRCAIE